MSGVDRDRSSTHGDPTPGLTVLVSAHGPLTGHRVPTRDAAVSFPRCRSQTRSLASPYTGQFLGRSWCACRGGKGHRIATCCVTQAPGRGPAGIGIAGGGWFRGPHSQLWSTTCSRRSESWRSSPTEVRATAAIRVVARPSETSAFAHVPAVSTVLRHSPRVNGLWARRRLSTPTSRGGAEF